MCELEVFDDGELLDDLAGLVEAIDGMRNAGAALHEGRQPRGGAIVLTRKPTLVGVSVELGTISDAAALY